MVKMVLLCLCFFSAVYAAPKTLRKDFPTPFAYYENLYFCEKHSTFFEILSSKPSPFADSTYEHHYSWKIVSRFDERIPIELIKGTTLVLCEVFEMRNDLSHFFHLLEHIVGHWSFYAHNHFQEVTSIVLASDGSTDTNKNWEGPNEMNRHLLKALFPNAKVWRWSEFVERYENKVVRFEKALVSDRAITFKLPICFHLNKMLGAALPYLSSSALEEMAMRMHLYANVKRKADESIEITYTKRHPPRTLSPEIEEKLLQEIAEIEGVSLHVVDFATISFLEQIDIIANTDILLGVHGNGLSHLLFLPKNAAVIEISSQDAQMLDYRLFADARNLDYLGIISNVGPIERERAYELGAIGNPNTMINTLDNAPILEFIKKRIVYKKQLREE